MKVSGESALPESIEQEKEVSMLSVANQSESTGIRLCHACNNDMLVCDRYCRRCGAQQTESMLQNEIGKQSDASIATTKDLDDMSSFVTAPLQTEDLYHTVSSPLVKSVTERLAANKTARLKSRWSRGLILALISIPIWLMIVLLSPFDAYTAARSTVEQH